MVAATFWTHLSAGEALQNLGRRLRKSCILNTSSRSKHGRIHVLYFDGYLEVMYLSKVISCRQFPTLPLGEPLGLARRHEGLSENTSSGTSLVRN